jgi:hypothetical protein
VESKSGWVEVGGVVGFWNRGKVLAGRVRRGLALATLVMVAVPVVTVVWLSGAAAEVAANPVARRGTRWPTIVSNRSRGMHLRRA